MKINPAVFVSNFLLTLILSSNAYANEITIYIPKISDSPKQHVYFHELLKTALENDGINPRLVTPELPQRRSKLYLDSGDISVFWMLESEERNRKYIPIAVGLTNGLISKRILFIKKGDQHLYDNVTNLSDFRNLDLVGGMGEKWFDARVWKANKLRYKEHSGQWKSIFRMVAAGRDYNYFSRGLSEILVESEDYPELDIEQNLVLIYARDFRFYLSKTGKNSGGKYRDIIEKALLKAEKNGLINELVKKYWALDFEKLYYDKRIKIQLITPN